MGERRSALPAAWFAVPDVDSAGNQGPDLTARPHPVTNPLEPDHDSATKPISVPLGSRSPFRTEADRDSAGKPISFRPLAER
jgi:hypothetical protein